LLNKPYATSQSFEMHQIALLSISNMWVISRLCSPFDTASISLRSVSAIGMSKDQNG